MRKKALSIALALSMMTSCVSLGSVAASAASVSDDAVAAASDYNLPSRIQDGNILHCFDWKYNDIKAELGNIAAAGFTAVQTSPAQNPKESGQWYWLYQPRGFNIASNGPLGTKAELKSLCTTADSYGIKVIVDVVANHLNDNNSTIEDGMSASQYWHSDRTITNYEDRDQVINGRVGMRDLNTSNTTLQNKVKSYIADLKAQGVDGIRWDAAKHIGLPSEGESFWTNVLDQTMYNYGEIYDKPGGNYQTVISGYTSMMGVTDHPYSGEIMGHVRDNDVYAPSGFWTTDYGVDAEKVVLFAENHDTFANDTNDGGWTKNLNQNQVDRAYAIVAARADSQALYLSRPSSTNKDNIYAGVKGSTHFTSSEVAAVNAFHNAMVGTDEAYTTTNDCTIVSREGGAVIVSPTGSNVSVTVPNTQGMVPAGSYVDKVSGTQWTVTATAMTGTIGNKGIAVIYGDPVTPPVTTQPVTTQPVTTQPVTTQPVTTQPATTTPVPSERVLIGDVNGNGSVTIKDASFIQAHLAQFQLQQLTGNALLAADVDQDGSVNIKDVTAIQRYLADLSGSECHAGEYIGGEPTSDPVTQPTDPTTPAGTRTILFTDNKGWGSVNIHYWGGATETEWPGVAMTPAGTNGYGQAQFSFEIPTDTTGMVFNGAGGQTVNVTYDSVSTGWYPLDTTDGEGHFEVGSWIDEDPTSPVIIPSDPTDPITPDTRTILFTDNKGWGSVNIHYWGGATETEWPGVAMTPAGTNGYGQAQFSFEIPTDTTGMVFNGAGGQTVNVTYDSVSTGWYPLDTTDGEGHFEVGSWIDEDPTDPVIDPTDPITPDTHTIVFTDNKNWGSVNVHYWGGSSETVWPGVAMTSIGYNDYGEQQFSAEIPADTTNLVFNGSGAQTVDITFDSAIQGWYLLDTIDGQGHYEVGTFGGPSILDPTDTVKILFTNNFFWNSVYAYAWDNDGNEVLGGWPGTAMTGEGDNGYGSPQFSVMVPTSATYIIFTDGSNQTVDIPFDASVTGYYLTGTVDGSNHYEVDSWTDDQNQGQGQGQGGESTTSTVLFTNNKGWGAVSCYAWDENETKLLGEWPGTPMTSLGNNDYGEPQYSIAVPDSATHIIFTDGDSQTVDISFTPGSIGYYLTDQTNGKWNVNTWVPAS